LTLLRLHFFILAFSDDYWLPCGAGHDRVVNAQPEYEDVRAIAIAQGLPWREVHQLAIGQWLREHG
jgi:uncharacterized protein (DUF111 family)